MADVTLDTYSHVMSNLLEDAAAAMDRVLQSQASSMSDDSYQLTTDLEGNFAELLAAFDRLVDYASQRYASDAGLRDRIFALADAIGRDRATLLDLWQRAADSQG